MKLTRRDKEVVDSFLYRDGMTSKKLATFAHTNSAGKVLSL